MIASLPLPNDPKLWAKAAEGLVAVNMALIQRLRLPPLYSSHIVYRPEVTERWENAQTLNKRGYGDCEDLAAYRVAELRLNGEHTAKVFIYRSGQRRWHAVVKRAKGQIEDPTKIIKAKEARQKRALNRKVSGVMDELKIKARLVKIPGGWKGSIAIPLSGFGLAGEESVDRAITVFGIGSTKASAIKKAATLGLNAIATPGLIAPTLSPSIPGMSSYLPGFGLIPSQAQQYLMQAQSGNYAGLMQHLLSKASGGTSANSLAQAIPATIPGAPPEAQAALVALKTAATLAENPKVKAAVRKGWAKVKALGTKAKKVKSFFQKLF